MPCDSALSSWERKIFPSPSLANPLYCPDADAVAEIALTEITKQFPGAARAVESCSLRVADGEYLVVLGPSGCGKTTLLRLIAGLERPDSGVMRLDGRDLADVRPHDRGIGMIFQDSALYPHMTIRANLAFPLRTRGIGRVEVNRRIESLGALLHIGAKVDRKPGELSGGERQRAALGRALIIQPRALLLDEPLSHLDAHLRDELRLELKRIHEELRSTVIHVTHDQEEAMALGHRIAIMAEGAVQQIGTPEELMHRPANRFVAAFLGRPTMNFLAGRLRASNDRPGTMMLERDGGSQLTLPIARDAVPTSAIDRDVQLGIRPGAISLTADASEPHLTVTVRAVHRRFDDRIISVELSDGGILLLRWPADAEHPDPGQRIMISWLPRRTHVFAPGPFGSAIR